LGEYGLRHAETFCLAPCLIVDRGAPGPPFAATRVGNAYGKFQAFGPNTNLPILSSTGPTEANSLSPVPRREAGSCSFGFGRKTEA
jgi:hypothetical protein